MSGAQTGTVERGGERRWCQFSLRLLLTVVTLCAILLGLMMWRIRRREEAVAAVRELGGSVILGSEAPVPEWLRRVVPSRVIVVDLAGTRATNASLARLEGLTALRTLKLDNTNITRGGLEHLAGLTALEVLSLAGTGISDDDVVHLERLRNLARLDLRGTQVADAGLEHLQGMTALEDLSICDTQVTDAGLQHLRGLTGLKRLSLEDGQITTASIKHLEALSGLERILVHVPRGTGKQTWTLLRALPTVESSGLLPPEGPAVWEGSAPWGTTPAGVAEAILSAVELGPEETARLLVVLAETRSRNRWGGTRRVPQPQPAFVDADRIGNVEQLIEAVRKWEDGRFYRAIRELPVDLGERAIPAVLPLLEDRDLEVRCRAAQLLCRLGRGDGRIAVTLARMLKDEPLRARSAAANALEQMAPHMDKETANTVVPLLLEALGDEHWWVKSAGAGALGGIGAKHPEHAGAATAGLLKAIQDEHGHARSYAARAFDPLAQGNPERAEAIVSALVEMIQSKETDRRQVAIALGGVGRAGAEAAKSAVPALLDILRDENSWVSREAAEALGRIVERNPAELKAIVPELFRMLEDPDASVRSAAERAFSSLAKGISENVPRGSGEP